MSIAHSNRSYWNRRAESYSELNQGQLHGPRAEAWSRALAEPLAQAGIVAAEPPVSPGPAEVGGSAGPGDGAGRPERPARILDIGCGPGFFSLLLAKRGWRVTGVDYTPNMLAHARRNAQAEGVEATFVEADAERLPFPDCSFDAVVSRNLTWNLPDPEACYREWRRVLVPGGALVNFDANWYRYLYSPEARQAYDSDRENTRRLRMQDACEPEGYADMEAIAQEVPLSRIDRPAWDVQVLRDLGMRVQVDEDIWRRVWEPDEQVNFASTPLFRIVAVR